MPDVRALPNRVVGDARRSSGVRPQSGRIDGGAGSDRLNLRLDDRTGGNSGATTGTLANVVNAETLAVEGGTWTIQDGQSYSTGIAIDGSATLTVGAAGSLSGAVTNAGRLNFAHSVDLTATNAISRSPAATPIPAAPRPGPEHARSARPAARDRGRSVSCPCRAARPPARFRAWKPWSDPNAGETRVRPCPVLRTDGKRPLTSARRDRSRGRGRRQSGAGEGNRTLVFSLEGCCSTIELHPPSASHPRRPVS